MTPKKGNSPFTTRKPRAGPDAPLDKGGGERGRTKREEQLVILKTEEKGSGLVSSRASTVIKPAF